MNCFKNCCGNDANIEKEKKNEITTNNIINSNNIISSQTLDRNIDNLIKNENDNEINIELNELKEQKRLLQRSIEKKREEFVAVNKEYKEQIAKLERKKTELDLTQNQLAIIQNKIKSVPKDYKTQIAELEQKNTDLDKQILEHQNEIQEQNNNINQEKI